MAHNQLLNQASGSYKYKYNGKELDVMHGLNTYDFEARPYDLNYDGFWTADPLAEKKPWLSPYIYCSDNPLNRVDPDGQDDYQLDREGRITLIKQTDAENHTIYASNAKGEIDKKNSLEVNKYILDNKESVTINTRASDGSTGTTNLDIYTSLGDDKSTAFFEFAANNTDVEWSQVKTTKDGAEINYVATSHVDGEDYSQDFLVSKINSQYDKGLLYNSIMENSNVDIREVNHNHPNNSNFSQADVNIASKIQSKFPNAKMNVYRLSNYTPYDQTSVPGILNEVIVLGKKH